MQFQHNTPSYIYNLFYSQIQFTLTDKTIRYEPLSILPLYIESSFSVAFDQLFTNKKITILSPILTFQIMNCKENKSFTIVDQFQLNCETHTTTYYLNSCIYHIGHLNGGHYIAIVKKNNDFYVCNDHSISKLTNNQFFSTHIPLLLFYTIHI